MPGIKGVVHPMGGPFCNGAFPNDRSKTWHDKVHLTIDTNAHPQSGSAHYLALQLSRSGMKHSYQPTHNPCHPATPLL